MRLAMSQQVRGAVAYTNRRGQAVRVDGPPVWASSDPAVATVTAEADGMSALVAGVAPGETTVTVTADADMDAGEERHIVLTEPFTVTEDEAAGGSFSFGAPEDQPTPPAPEEDDIPV